MRTHTHTHQDAPTRTLGSTRTASYFRAYSTDATTASQPDLSLLPVWYEYLAFEESKRDPGRIQTLYERVICSYCLVTVHDAADTETHANRRIHTPRHMTHIRQWYHICTQRKKHALRAQLTV